jgi:hypothetical protein
MTRSKLGLFEIIGIPNTANFITNNEKINNNTILTFFSGKISEYFSNFFFLKPKKKRHEKK